MASRRAEANTCTSSSSSLAVVHGGLKYRKVGVKFQLQIQIPRIETYIAYAYACKANCPQICLTLRSGLTRVATGGPPELRQLHRGMHGESQTKRVHVQSHSRVEELIIKTLVFECHNCNCNCKPQVHVGRVQLRFEVCLCMCMCIDIGYASKQSKQAKQASIMRQTDRQTPQLPSTRPEPEPEPEPEPMAQCNPARQEKEEKKKKR
ncbi:hypothetical protein DFH27DRAFT_526344 [Peziza echinospora]|nr:hypothetical protein DFH27DRAFT_526344 [Peziza echinospora]